MISCVIGTFGADRWRDLAASRAYPSARDAGFTDVVLSHGETLAAARNAGAAHAEHGWIVFLDADDELAPGYYAAMERALARHEDDWTTSLFTPAIQWIHRRREYRPRFMPEVSIDAGNWLVIGTMLLRDELVEVGGFEEWPMYEDWALFARIQKQMGATVARVPDAVYRAHRSNGRSRNHPAGGTEGRRLKLAAHDAIRRAVFPELYEEATG